MLDPSAPAPLYRQLADELLRAVENGALAEGARIPSEHDLAKHHRVGRPTVRQATEVLVRQGILERRRGSGTFVGKAPAPVDLFTLSGTVAAFEGSGLLLKTRLIERPRLRQVADTHTHPFRGRRAITLTRLGQVERSPVLLEQLFLDPELFAGVEQGQVGEGSLSRWLRETKGKRPSGGHQTFAVEPVHGRHAELLGVAESTPLLTVLRTLDFPELAAGLFARMICRTDKVQLSQALRADGSICHDLPRERHAYGDVRR